MSRAKSYGSAKTEDESVAAPEPKEIKTKHNADNDMVIVNCFVPVHINGKEFFGEVRVSRAQAESLNEMLSKKKASDSRIHIGREFERSRVDGQLIVRDAHTKQRLEPS